MTDDEAGVPIPGAVYRHYKGDLYRVLAVGRMSNTEAEDQTAVVYRSDGREVRVRTLLGPDGWATPTADGQMRFRPYQLAEPRGEYRVTMNGRQGTVINRFSEGRRFVRFDDGQQTYVLLHDLMPVNPFRREWSNGIEGLR